MKQLEFFNYKFLFVKEIEFELCKNNLYFYEPQNRYNNKKNLKLHQYGSGSFCRFSIPDTYTKIKCVYLIFDSKNLSKPLYIGRTDNFKKRFNSGYGNISPRNCFEGGQSTNCRMNKNILNKIINNKTIFL